MPAKLTFGNIRAHNRYMASMGSPAIASKKMERRVSSAMKRKTDPTHTGHTYPKAGELAMSLRNEPAVFNLATQKLKQTQKRRSKVPIKATKENKEEKKESEAVPRDDQDEKGKPLCSILGGKKKKRKRKTKRRHRTKQRRKTRHRTKRRVKKHRKRKTLRR